MAATVAIIAGVVAAAGAVGNSMQAQAGVQAAARHAREAKQLLGAKKVMKLQKKLYPQFRESIASGLGPQFASNVATNISRRGLEGTGIGLSIKNAALAVPGVEAFRQSLAQAVDLRKGQAAIVAGQPIMTAPNPILAGLQSGLLAGGQAYLGATPPSQTPSAGASSVNTNQFLLDNPVPDFSYKNRG